MPSLTTVIVEHLLGEFDHRIDFLESWDYVIIYGPNGVGKTRLLEAVDAALELNMAALARVPFMKMMLSFSDGHLIEISRVTNGRPKPTNPRPRRRPAQRRIPQPEVTPFQYFYKLSKNGVDVDGFDVQIEPAESVLAEFLELETSWTQIGLDLWEDRVDGEVVRIDELRRRYGHRISDRDRTAVPDEIKSFVKDVPCHLIETQRLVTSTKRASSFLEPSHAVTPRATVSQYSDDLRRLLTGALAANSRFSQTLDRTFPRRILERSDEQTVGTEEDIRERYVRQNDLREGLSALGLIDAEPELPLPEKELENWERYVLATYLDDTDQKLATFGAILEKVSLLSDIVNSRFLRKRLAVTSDSGLTIRKILDDEQVPLESLSSGEQHELILFYDLLFNVSPNSVVLIDEPEISLHVVWQQRFLHDLSRVAQAASLRFVIATHSPQLIHKSWHRTIELGGDAGF